MEWVLVGIVALVMLAVYASHRKAQAAEAHKSAFNTAMLGFVNEWAEGQNAALPVLDPAEWGYRPVGGEKLLQVQPDVGRMEYKSTDTYSLSGTSISIPIMKGVRYRVGSGKFRRPKEWVITDTGTLFITDKAVSFEGSARNDRWTWAQIADIEVAVDGYQISRRRGQPVLLACAKEVIKPEVAAMINILLRRVS